MPLDHHFSLDEPIRQQHQLVRTPGLNHGEQFRF
jgi:hypothetical protein